MASKAPPTIPEELLARADKLIPVLSRQSLYGTASRRHVFLHAYVLGLEVLEAAAAAGRPIPPVGMAFAPPAETFPPPTDPLQLQRQGDE